MQFFNLPDVALALTPVSWSLEFVAMLGAIIALSFVFRYISGWASLMQIYQTQERFPGKVNWFCSGSMNSVHFNRTLIAGADMNGLYLASLFPFNFALTPLLIPWADITAAPTKIFLFRYIEFRFRQAPNAVLRVSEDLGRKLLFGNPVAPNLP